MTEEAETDQACDQHGPGRWEWRPRKGASSRAKRLKIGELERVLPGR